MQVDSFLTKGTAHSICEDYIRHGTKPFPYVILSDGCSSSHNTDIGARILVSQAHRTFLDDMFVEFKADKGLSLPKFTVLQPSLDVVTLMGLDHACLDATLMCAMVVEDQILVRVFGDGSIIQIMKDGRVQIMNYSYAENAPFYLSYLKSSEDVEKYLKKFSPYVFEKRYFAGVNMYNNNIPVNKPFQINIPKKDVKAVLIASDGIESFSGDFADNIVEVVNEFTSFKNIKGEFVKRRSNKAIKKLGTHYDDISIGGFYFDSV
jgi:hypothetical protein